MELQLTNEDLKKEHRHLNASQTRFAHFSPQAQRAIRIVGRAQYVARDTYNAINPPRAK